MGAPEQAVAGARAEALQPAERAGQVRLPVPVMQAAEVEPHQGRAHEAEAMLEGREAGTLEWAWASHIGATIHSINHG